MKAPAVQVTEAPGVGGKQEGQLVGIEGLIGPVKPLVQLAIFPVPQQRVTGVGKLGPDLMGPAGDELTFYQAQAVSAVQHLVVGLAGFGAGFWPIGNKDTVLHRVFE